MRYLSVKMLIMILVLTTGCILSSNANRSPSPGMSVSPNNIGRTELPSDYDTWWSIQEGKKIYVDKTKFLSLHQFQSGLNFLRRPPGFGTSMFLQMIASFYKGEKHYFNGTSVHQYGNTRSKNGSWIRYPVIHINFDSIPIQYSKNLTLREIMRDIYNRTDLMLRNIATITYEIDIPKWFETDTITLSDLISLLHGKFHLPVVILIDKYDSIIKKVRSNLDRNFTECFQADLEQFYSQIKAAHSTYEVKLALVTGVHPFDINTSELGANNIVDISWDSEFATCIGFTKDEIETTFKSEISDFAAHLKTTPDDITNQLKYWYGGYSFSEKDTLNEKNIVYNPISVLNALKKFKFDLYWVNKTANADVIAKKMNSLYYSFDELKNYRLHHSFDLNPRKRYNPIMQDEIPVPEMMLQTGYLKLVSYTYHPHSGDLVVLNYPNWEIETGLNRSLHLAAACKNP
ncbi:uncharacterized protein in vnfD 5'region-like [Planococcus citri]|uniref:uncharacterized protein in vnfD 5'region-like n=1 Tax=Planococcus citri TaxID=170843 RepID=UPI0031F9A608